MPRARSHHLLILVLLLSALASCRQPAAETPVILAPSPITATAPPIVAAAATIIPPTPLSTATPQSTPTPLPTATPALRPAVSGFVVSTVWHWTKLVRSDGQTIVVTNPHEYALVFWFDGTFNVLAKCNAGGGAYVLGRDGALTLALAPMTHAQCAPDSHAREYLAALTTARSLADTDQDELIMTLDNGDSLVLADLGRDEAIAAGLVDLTLRWPGYDDASGNPFRVDDPELYALLLHGDGTYTAWADCNVVWGAFVYTAPEALTLLPGPAAGVLCNAGSQSETFLDFLAAVRGVTVSGDGLVTMTTVDGRRSTFLDLGPVEGPVVGRPASDVPPERLFNKVWQWVSSSYPNGGGIEVNEPDKHYFVLLDGSTYAFVDGCNRGAFGYGAGDGWVAFDTQGVEANPLKQCDEGQGSDLLGTLMLAETYTLVDDQLVLGLFAGGVATLRDGGPFFNADHLPVGLAGVTWQWTALNADGQALTVPESVYFTILFDDNGRVDVVADCNWGHGAYSTELDGSVALMVSRSLMITCPHKVWVDWFFNYLNQATALQVNLDGALTLELAGGGTMTFAPAP